MKSIKLVNNIFNVIQMIIIHFNIKVIIKMYRL